MMIDNQRPLSVMMVYPMPDTGHYAKCIRAMRWLSIIILAKRDLFFLRDTENRSSDLPLPNSGQLMTCGSSSLSGVHNSLEMPGCNDQKQEHSMSTAADSVMELIRSPESSPINAAYLLMNGRRASLERTDSSFLDTIVGRRGSLRSILSQVDAVASTNTTVLITGETAPARRSSRERFTS